MLCGSLDVSFLNSLFEKKEISCIMAKCFKRFDPAGTARYHGGAARRNSSEK